MKTEWAVAAGVLLGGAALIAFAIRYTRHLNDKRDLSTAGDLMAVKSANESTAEKGERVNDSSSSLQDDRFVKLRQEMVQHQLLARDISDSRVREAMRRVPRHLFVPSYLIDQAYQDQPLPIGHQQTISQPYIVALMTQLAHPHPDAIALDVGTGSGYQAAVLAELCKKVYCIEIVAPLAASARQRLERLGYKNVTVRHGDGYQGWAEQAPFDLIIVAAAPDHIPKPLLDQLKPSGHLVIPVGKDHQTLRVVEKQADGSVRERNVVPVVFVPMTGQALEQPKD